MNRQKRFHHGHGDFVGLKRHDRAIAADDLVLTEELGREGLLVFWTLRRQACCAQGKRCVECCLHFFLVGGSDRLLRSACCLPNPADYLLIR